MHLSDEKIGKLLEWFESSSQMRTEWLPKRLNAIKKNHEWIQPEMIENMSDEELKNRYLDYFNSGTGEKQSLIHINKFRPIENIDKFRQTILYLLNETIPIKERLNSVLDGEIHLNGMGKAMVTAFLMDFNPEKYCLWNGKTEDGFKVLGWDFSHKGDTRGDVYKNVLELINKLKNLKPELNLTFTDVDLFLHTIAAEDEGKKEVYKIKNESTIQKWIFAVNIDKYPNFTNYEKKIWSSPENLKKGDIILFYCSQPLSSISEIYMAQNDSYNDKKNTEFKGPIVNILKKIILENPVTWEELVNHPELKDCNLVKKKFGQSHYKLPQDMWNALMRFIIEKNPQQKDQFYEIFSEGVNISPKPKNDFLEFLNQTYSQEKEIGLNELQRGKNLIFFGPPGSGKTVLSKIISEEYLGKNAYSLYTVHSGTDYYDLVCRIVPEVKDGNLIYSKEKRFLLDALLSEKVLILDEINRTQIDTALGIFFTYLEREHRLNDAEHIRQILLKEADEDLDIDNLRNLLDKFRIIGTLNVYDKTFLFKLGDALKRRFTFIEITTKNDLIEELKVSKRDDFLKSFEYKGDYETADIIIDVFGELNKIKPLGIGILKDTLLFTSYYSENFADLAISSLIVPFFENDLNYSNIRTILERHDLNNSISKLNSLNFGTSDINGI
ncbi:MAG: hypothetical protein CVV28_02885 [Methanobacteriales archaeon HGW-Methanobacteriales-1]|jgi:5-methylcytosine-specific restriction protein B|nr:MAG: hypothetical protein CVV28_02885 [Methanobacteriales archaeon HGW-Methanobacteriales-1]